MSDLEQWISQVAAGTAAPRDGAIEFLTAGGQVARSILLTGLVPLRFSLFPSSSKSGSKELTLRLGHFLFQ
jgi:hypothetical protein